MLTQRNVPLNQIALSFFILGALVNYALRGHCFCLWKGLWFYLNGLSVTHQSGASRKA